MTFTCGCESSVPCYMGRGKARKRRLANYFGRLCLACRLQPLMDDANRIVHGDGRPYTAAERDATFARWAERVANNY